MNSHTSTIRAASLAVAAGMLTALAGCNSGPHQQPAPNSAVTHDPKDGGKEVLKNSGPHQHGDSREPVVGSSGPHQ